MERTSGLSLANLITRNRFVWVISEPRQSWSGLVTVPLRAARRFATEPLAVREQATYAGSEP